ncbi:MAG: hypothetical protein ABWY16_09730 [Pedobacter sp.]|uniref:hypothetical protein n=1 Tax=Pedobacter sp. TaxID=1411316 RepID=UPI003397861F
MKKLLLIAAIGIGSLAAVPAKAQVSLSVNIGLQPDWGPRGYNHVDYYYLPDVDSYYDVPTRQYVYLEGGSWVHRRYLPSRYRGYDLYGGRKIVINSRDPWLRHNDYRTRYVTNYRGGGYRGGRTTVIHRNNYFGPRGGYSNHGGPRGGYNNHGGGPRGGFNHGGPRGGNDHGGGNNHGGPGRGDNHGGGNNHGGGGGNHGGGNHGGGRGGQRG